MTASILYSFKVLERSSKSRISPSTNTMFLPVIFSKDPIMDTSLLNKLSKSTASCPALIKVTEALSKYLSDRRLISAEDAKIAADAVRRVQNALAAGDAVEGAGVGVDIPYAGRAPLRMRPHAERRAAADAARRARAPQPRDRPRHALRRRWHGYRHDRRARLSLPSPSSSTSF